jgi:hypothetical protein
VAVYTAPTTETVERGILMCLGRHLVPVLTTWFRIRWSYAHRVRDVAAWVSGIAKASPLMAHLANKYFNDISHADVANTKCERSAHTAGRRSATKPWQPMALLQSLLQSTISQSKINNLRCGGAGYCPRKMVSENLRRDGTLAGNLRESLIEAVPRYPAVFHPIPAVAAESRQRNGNGIP